MASAPPSKVSDRNDLPTSAKEMLAAASSESIVITLRKMRRRFRRWDRWLTAKHPYLDVVDALGWEPSTIDGVMLAEYLAASIPLHVVDGWVFLARAFDSIKSGDRNTAMHLAYYAELRAAMSLLASEGVGVFNMCHVAIDQNYETKIWNRKGTHVVTWNLLKAWANDRSRVQTLLNAVKVELRTIDEWIGETVPTQTVKHLVAKDWLESWSVDIGAFEADREYRNHASYRPSTISPKSMVALNTATEIIDPLLKTWGALEPSSDSGGAAIDQVLLFRALTLAHNQSSLNQKNWFAFVDRLDNVASESLQTYLKNSINQKNDVLTWADNSKYPPPAQSVLARATLLLRIANGVCARHLADAGVAKQDLQFWWTGYGKNGGLWPDGDELDSFADLWTEVYYALDDIEDELDSDSPLGTTYDLSQVLGPKLVLTQFSRVPLWLLGEDW